MLRAYEVTSLTLTQVGRLRTQPGCKVTTAIRISKCCFVVVVVVDDDDDHRPHGRIVIVAAITVLIVIMYSSPRPWSYHHPNRHPASASKKRESEHFPDYHAADTFNLSCIHTTAQAPEHCLECCKPGHCTLFMIRNVQDEAQKEWRRKERQREEWQRQERQQKGRLVTRGSSSSLQARCLQRQKTLRS